MQVVLLTIVPLLCVPLFTPMWARMFDAGHVVEFRARQCWVLIVRDGRGDRRRCSPAVTPLLWVAALLFGIATAGANLGWNLGHNDFASLGKVQQYMGVNVTLTGMRGLIAPPAGRAGLHRAGARATRVPAAMRCCCRWRMTLAGAIGFKRHAIRAEQELRRT